MSSVQKAKLPLNPLKGNGGYPIHAKSFWQRSKVTATKAFAFCKVLYNCRIKKNASAGTGRGAPGWYANALKPLLE